MYTRPKRFRGRFLVTTRKGRTVTTGCAIEQVEWIACKGRDRTIWEWFFGRYIARN